MKKLIAIALAVVLVLTLSGSAALANNGDTFAEDILLMSETWTWTDPDSEGQVEITLNLYELVNHDMKWEYEVYNVSYDPEPGYTNGFSGFQIIFTEAVPELYNQTSPSVGGTWEQNAYSGVTNGVEWDVRLANGNGIMIGETGTFSFCTAEREPIYSGASGSGQGPAGWAHTWGLTVPEPIIDLDGTATSGVGSTQEVAIGDSLVSWPTGMDVEGIDWFDNDLSTTWTAGDGIHVEGPAYAGAIRDGTHDATDPVVVGTMAVGAPVSVDMESGLIDPSGTHPSPGSLAWDPRIRFHNANGMTNWDDGEDIVLDLNNDGFYGIASVVDTQTYIHHGWIQRPGQLISMLGVASSGDDIVWKKVKYVDEDGDGIIEVGELVYFLVVIQVNNPSGENWEGVHVKDRFGAELGVEVAPVSSGETVDLNFKGKSDKVFLEWNVGDLDSGDTASLVLFAWTDTDPGGNQSYTECCWHEFNSGVTVKYRDERNKQHSAETGSVMVSVLSEDYLTGDCDGDGFTDAEELAAGTDPHNIEDHPPIPNG